MDYGSDTCSYRTNDESYYLAEFMTWGEGDPTGKANEWWSGHESVSQDAIFWKSLLIPPAFKQIQHKDGPFFAKTVHFERRFRS